MIAAGHPWQTLGCMPGWTTQSRRLRYLCVQHRSRCAPLAAAAAECAQTCGLLPPACRCTALRPNTGKPTQDVIKFADCTNSRDQSLGELGGAPVLRPGPARQRAAPPAAAGWATPPRWRPGWRCTCAAPSRKRCDMFTSMLNDCCHHCDACTKASPPLLIRRDSGNRHSGQWASSTGQDVPNCTDLVISRRQEAGGTCAAGGQLRRRRRC